MEKLSIDLPEAEFQRLNLLYPFTVKSSTVGGRAVELVQFHFRSIESDCAFSIPSDGSDLEIRTAKGSQRIEVKGTSASDVSWAKLKVSGGRSHAHLLAGMPLYRVCDVYGRAPVILILRHEEDFELVPEPRWRICPRKREQP